MRIAFVHPIKLEDHFFVEAHEVAIASELTALGHETDVVDYLFDRERGEAEQIEDLAARVNDRAYDVVFLRTPWTEAVSRALARVTKHLVGWQSRDLVEQSIADLAVTHATREVVRGLVEALAAGAELTSVPGLLLRRGAELLSTPSASSRSTYDELHDAPLDPSRRVTLSKRGPNVDRAVVVSNLGCAYRNIPNRSEVFEGVVLPPGVKTSGCTFCGVSAYEKMTEDQAIEILLRQIDAELRHRPALTEIAIKDDFALRFLGKLGARATEWSALSGIALSGRTILLSARPDYLLTFREAIDDALAGAFPSALGFYLLGYENFSDAELHRYHKGMTGAEIERALDLMDGWAEKFPQRFRISPTSGFILFGPWTTLEDLRINASVMRRRGFTRFRGRALLSQLRLHPEQPLYWLAQRDGLLETTQVDPQASDAFRRGYRMDTPWRFADPKVAQVHAAVLASAQLPDDALFEVFEEALDAAAGQARGKNKRPLRMVRAPNDRKSSAARTQQITVGSTCNQNCGFCTYRAAEEREPLKLRAARSATEIREAASAGVERIVLTGAEPMLQPHFLELARLAKNLGVREVEIETNATLLGATLARDPVKGEAALAAMKEAGIVRARVALNATTAERSDAITRDPGGFARTMRAIEGLLGASIGVELAVALVPESRGELVRVLALAAELEGRYGVSVDVVARWIHHARPGAALLLPDAARTELLLGHAAAEQLRVKLRVAPSSELPPCVYPTPGSVPNLLRVHASLVEKEAALPAASRRHRRVEACASCSAAEVCPGPLATLADALAPLTRSLAAGELSERDTRSTERDRQLREYKSELTSHAEGGSHERRILRLVFHCNQACDFCFVSRELPPIEHERLVADIEECGQRGIAIDFSGGEPTLHPNVLDYIRLAKAHGVPRVELQTNAIKMADRAFARSLKEAGLDSAFVSLHGTSAAVSDRVTAAPGTFDRTVRGVANLVAEGLPVQLNFVVCGANVAELAGYPDFVHEHFVAPFPAARPLVGITLSYAAASTDNVPRDGRLIPRISSVAAPFERAIERSALHGIPVSGLDTKCGVPACYLPRSVREVAFAHPVPASERARAAAGFTRAPACDACDYADRCYGIRSSYAELHGTDELRAIRNGLIVPQHEGGAEHEDHPRAADPFARIGLSETHRLRPDARARVFSDAAFETPKDNLVALTGDAASRDLVQLRADLRVLVKIERSTVALAEKAAQADDYKQRGYVSRVFVAPAGPNGVPRGIAFIAKSEAVLDEAVAIESGLTRSKAEREEGVRQMGRLLGYPPCCVEAFAANPEQNDATWIRRLIREHEGSHLPLMNWASPQIRTFSHFPCTAQCQATLELSRRTMMAFAETSPRYAAALDRALRSVAIVLDADRYVLLEERDAGHGVSEPGVSYSYGRVWSHHRLGMDTLRAGDPEYRAFEIEVVERLAEGDRVLRTPHGLTVYEGSRRLHEIVFAGDAPRLLDFRGRRVLPRLRVLSERD